HALLPERFQRSPAGPPSRAWRRSCARSTAAEGHHRHPSPPPPGDSGQPPIPSRTDTSLTTGCQRESRANRTPPLEREHTPAGAPSTPIGGRRGHTPLRRAPSCATAGRHKRSGGARPSAPPSRGVALVVDDDLLGCAYQLEDMHPRVRAVHDVYEPTAIELDVVRLDDELTDFLSTDRRASHVRVLGGRRDVESHFLRAERLADVDGANASVEPRHQ